MLEKIMVLYLLFINFAAFVLFGVDKRKAVRDQWRIPEKTLLLVSLFGGSFGAFAGMKKFRHKTKHWQFMLGVPACMLLHVGLAVAYLWFFG